MYFSGDAVFIGSHLFRRADGNNLAAFVAAAGLHIDDPVGHFDHMRLCSITHHRIAGIHQFVQYPQ